MVMHHRQFNDEDYYLHDDNFYHHHKCDVFHTHHGENGNCSCDRHSSYKFESTGIPGMYSYRRSEPRLWTVGFFGPDGMWEPESDHDSAMSAAARVNYLNGWKPGSSITISKEDAGAILDAVRDVRGTQEAEDLILKIFKGPRHNRHD